MTVYVVVITANHYVLDAVAGFALFAAAYYVARKFTKSGRGEPVSLAPSSAD
jgi:heme/copper-type cytochrome/quinol oxidase subunit 1